MSETQSLYDLLKEQNGESSDSGICLEKWRELGENGAGIPVKMSLHGISMKPLIRPEKDIVTIMPLVRNPMVGDIVMFRRADGKNIAHRVYRVFPNGIQTWGDNCQRPDAPIKREDIYGLIVSMEKNGRTYLLDTDKQRAYGIRWMKYARPAWIVLQKIRAIGGKIIRCVYPVFHKKRSAE
jgi:hypothetical protein